MTFETKIYLILLIKLIQYKIGKTRSIKPNIFVVSTGETRNNLLSSYSRHTKDT